MDRNSCQTPRSCKRTGGAGGSEFLALCAIDTSAGGADTGFRYVADLARQTNATSPLPVAEVAWAPMLDGRLVYTAATPKITATNPLGLPMSSGGESGLFVATPGGAALTAEEGRRLGTSSFVAPAFQATTYQDGSQLLALARSDQGNKPLVIRRVDPVDGTVQDLGITLPQTVGSSGAITARWDLVHGRLLVLARGDASNTGP